MSDCFGELQINQLLGGERARCICGLVPSSVFLDGRVKGHERTLSSRLQRQNTLVRADQGALGKPVLLTVRDLGPALDVLDEHFSTVERVVRYRADRIEYLLTERQPKPGGSYSIDLEALGTIAIADGHHRAETHARLAETGMRSCDETPVCVVGIDELTIGIFMRQIAVYEKSLGALLYSLAPYFEVQELEEARAPTEAGEWLMTYRRQYFRLTRRGAVPGAYSTPTGWFVGEVLASVFRIDNPSTSDVLENIPVDVLPTGLLDIPDTKVLSFAGSPLSRALFLQEVEAGRLLPPKSTRFIPRVPSGLVVWRGC